ncbi:MAG: phosphate transport system protein [Pseudomonadota bacterium]|nr:phosphate transport system protein [Pseudomonadota bacterium]
MNRFNTGHHISVPFDHDLESIRNKVALMGKLVEQQLTLAVDAFTNGDIDLAEKVLIQDDEIDLLETSIDNECAAVIALRQPVGHDLALLIDVIKVTNELENIAAKAEGIADITIELNRSLPASDSHG